MTKTLIKIGAITVDSADYEMPVERIFREAWSFQENQQSGVIAVDMIKARDIWRDKIRQARLLPLQKLDADFMKALETNSDVSAIIVQKQALRDAPAHSSIEAAQTPEELKLVQPAGLQIG
jgi:hypothetical protein